ncbi:MAG: CoA-binding protein [Cyclobacteriaceae bacterium]
MKTVVVGATVNPERYAFKAATKLVKHQQEIELIGIKKGKIEGISIKNLREKPDLGEIDTITLYIGPNNQEEWIDYLIGLKPRRIIFNPGTENQNFVKRAIAKGIFCEEACTLVLLQTNQY